MSLEKKPITKPTDTDTPKVEDNITKHEGGSDKPQVDIKNKSKKDDVIPKASYDVVADKYRTIKAELDKLKEKQEEAEKRQLEKKGKFKELAEKSSKELQQLKSNYNLERKTNALKVKALEIGTVDVDAVVKLANLEDVVLTEDGQVEEGSINKVLENLKSTKSYLFSEQRKVTVGGEGGTPEGGTEIKEFRRSQLKDTKFFDENKEAILKAQAEGRIIDDVTPQYNK